MQIGVCFGIYGLALLYFLKYSKNVQIHFCKDEGFLLVRTIIVSPFLKKLDLFLFSHNGLSFSQSSLTLAACFC